MSEKDYYQSLIREFAGKIKPLLEELEQHNEVEKYYRRCYELRNDPKALREYSATCGNVKTADLRLIRPPVSAEPIKLGEDFIFDSDSNFKNRNIVLIKHNRYAPFFEHSHNWFEIFLVFSGSCTNIIGGKQLLMTAGQLCFIAPNINHSLESIGDSIVINIIIRKSTFDEIFFNILTSNDILSQFFLGNLCFVHPIEYLIFNIDNDLEMIEQFFAMLIEQSRNDIHSDRIMNNRICIFFSLLVRQYGNRPIADGLRERYWNMIAYIHNNFRTVTLMKTANRFNLSVAHCSRLIKGITGKNFTTLLKDIRMKHAQAMLGSSNTRIYDISYFLGYENQETFIRAFKKEYGISPTQYRKGYGSAHLR
jgi:AraC-like DNA-binding protein/mannose-6-phosphate isomerase-like protein (cupin superfamily)